MSGMVAVVEVVVVVVEAALATVLTVVLRMLVFQWGVQTVARA